MQTAKGFFQSRTRRVWERPFDFYVASLLFLSGVVSIVNDNWPESLEGGTAQTFIVVVSIYLMFAGGIVMSSLLCKRQKRPVFALMGEMYGWLFVAAGSMASTIIYLWGILHGTHSDWGVWITLIIIWAGMTIASSIRFFDLIVVYRSLKK
jgi:hypothetical protein